MEHLTGRRAVSSAHGPWERGLTYPSNLASIHRVRGSIRTAAQRADIAREIGVKGTNRYLRDKLAGRAWAASARRALYVEIWEEAARSLSAVCTTLDDDFTLVEKDGLRTVAWFHNVQLDDPVTLRLALDKKLVHGLLREVGVPVPEHRVFSSADPADGLAFIEEGAGPFVVKPASGTSSGSGVTCAVDSRADFGRAVFHAAAPGEQLIVERTVPGDEYRFLFLDGELLDVIRRSPPTVVGDGRSSIAELMARENQLRAAGAPGTGISFLNTDLDCVLTLDLSGHSLRSVPADGETVVVKSAANLNAPRDNETVDRALVSPALLEETRRAAEAAHLRLAGVDLITPDISRALGEAGGAVIEVNGTPGFHYHYLVADPTQATRVAIPVLRTLLEDAAWQAGKRSGTRR